MKQFYVLKNKNYVTICNKALRDKELSLKAKGLYAFMTGLPKDWDYTINGLTTVLKEGKDGIQAALNELIKAGYLVRLQIKDEKQRYKGYAYILAESKKDAEKITTTVSGFSRYGKTATKEDISNDISNEKKEYNRFQMDMWGGSHHFANERKYSKEELDALIVDINDIDFD